jgi:hypothetical protein
MITRYKDYTIITKEIKRDWSEDAYKYEVTGTNIKDECEGEENAIKYAKEEIDKKCEL